jgi:DNA-binding XRE family transcriptional regulator
MSSPPGPRKLPYLRKHELTWPESLDREINAEVSRRITVHGQYIKSPHGQKRAIVRDALRVYLATARVRHEDSSTAIGPQLRAVRQAAGMSLRDTAAAAGDLSRAAISQIETEAEQPSLRALRALAKALDAVVVVDKHGVAVLQRRDDSQRR